MFVPQLSGPIERLAVPLYISSTGANTAIKFKTPPTSTWMQAKCGIRLGGDNDVQSTATLVPVVKGFAGVDLMHASLCIQKSSHSEGGSMRREVREGRNEFVPELPGLSERY